MSGVGLIVNNRDVIWCFLLLSVILCKIKRLVSIGPFCLYFVDSFAAPCTV